MTNILFTKKKFRFFSIGTISKTYVALNIHTLSLLKWRIVPTHMTLDFHAYFMLMISVLIPPFLAVTFMY